ncbi:MAG: FtsX-like permease family protein [Planctomycetes bacterium]|nr:FtsX-like permease family protein [Planctomycetota bacterium]
MRVQIAFHNLMHGRWRTLVSISGVSLAIVLVFMQMGFLGMVADTATLIYNHLEFDVLLRSPDYFYFYDARDIPRTTLYRVSSMPEVESVKPLQVVLAKWRVPEGAPAMRAEDVGGERVIVVMGVDPGSAMGNKQGPSGPPFRGLPAVASGAARLAGPQFLLIDQETKGDDFGAYDGEEFGDDDIDRDVEINRKRFLIRGYFRLGAGLAAKGSVIMSESGYARIYPGDARNNVSFGLVRLKAGNDPGTFCRLLEERLSSEPGAGSGRASVDVLTRRQVERYEKDRWLYKTPIGAIFISGVAVALVVGGVVVYMVLSNDVANHLREYATLKAMGYSNRYMNRIVMQQAVIMALLGYAASLLCAELLYRLVGTLANIPMNMSWNIRVVVFVLSVAMCCMSGVATLRKLRKAHPADLF